jgi:hypoxia up-regulated 1
MHISAAVIGIDFGSEYYKAVLVKPGAPFSIVENTSSNRKTENTMAFTNEERKFEMDAVTKSVSFPETTMLRSLFLLGMEYSDENLALIRDQYLLTNEFIKDSRGLIGYQINIPENDELTNIDIYVEEILTMILKHAKDLSKKQADGVVTDATITVPASFTLNQRIMIRDAAEMAGFNVLTLLHENTAAALMYGIDTKNLETPAKIMFINMGSFDLELSVVQYDKIIGQGKNGKDIISIHVLDGKSSKFNSFSYRRNCISKRRWTFIRCRTRQNHC